MVKKGPPGVFISTEKDLKGPRRPYGKDPKKVQKGPIRTQKDLIRNPLPLHTDDYSHGEKLLKRQSGEVEVWGGCSGEKYP